MPFPAFFLLAAALGAREGIRGRRTSNRILDQEAERQDDINNIDLGIDAMGGSNKFDAKQIEAMGRQFETAQGMLRSQDEKLQALGANMIADLDTAVRGNIQQNETEARAEFVRQQDQDVAAAGLGKADNEKRMDRELTMNRQLATELRTFESARLSFNKVSNLLKNDDQLASLAGLTAFVQAIDNSVVREGELLKYQGANGFITHIVNMVNKSEGRDFDPVTKQSIQNAAAALVNAEKTRAVAITNSYQDRAVSFGLSPERVMSGVDDTLFTPIVIDKSAQEAAEEEADAAEAAQLTFTEFADAEPAGAIERAFNAVGLEGPDLGAGVSAALDKSLQAWQDTGRALRGATLHIDPGTGELWERSADGEWRQIDGTPDQKRQAEILRLKNSTAKLPPDLQKRQDAIDAEEKRERRRNRLPKQTEPGLFQEGGFFDRD
jgi:hypothetical protein